MKPEISAGELDKRVTLASPVYNASQDEITGWTPVGDVWAAIDPNYGQELTESARTVASTLIPVVIRYRTDIDQRWRVYDRERTYEVKGILDIARRHIRLQLNCEEVK